MRLQWEWGVQQSTQHRTTRVSNNKKALAPISSLNRHIFQQNNRENQQWASQPLHLSNLKMKLLILTAALTFYVSTKISKPKRINGEKFKPKNPFIRIWQTKVQQPSKIVCFKQNGSHLPPFKEIFYWGKWKNKHTNCPAVTLENMTSISKKKNPTQNLNLEIWVQLSQQCKDATHLVRNKKSKMIPVHKVQSLWIKIMHAIHMFIYSSVCSD